MIKSRWWIPITAASIAAAGWYMINGLLHDYFVITRHKTGYDRDLMRLLLDGHLLIVSGIMMLMSWMMLLQEEGGPDGVLIDHNLPEEQPPTTTPSTRSTTSPSGRDSRY